MAFSRRQNRTRTIIRKVLFALLVTMAFFALVEGGVRLGERLVHGSFNVDGRPQGLYCSELSERPQLCPGARLDGWRYRISVNPLGFRGPELLPEKPANSLRIWCVGGSTTFDIYARDDSRTWPELLRAELQVRWPDTTIEVINAGIPGEIIDGNLQDFVDHHHDVQSDILIFHQGPNEIRKQTTYGIPFRSSLVMDRLATARVLGNWIEPERFFERSWPGHVLDSQEVDQIRSRVEEMLDAAARQNVAVVLASHALLAAPDDTGRLARWRVGAEATHMQLGPEEVIQAFSAYNTMIEELALKRGLPFVDLRGAIPPDKAYWGDATHFREPGSRRAAELFADAIVAMGEPDAGRVAASSAPQDAAPGGCLFRGSVKVVLYGDSIANEHVRLYGTLFQGELDRQEDDVDWEVAVVGFPGENAFLPGTETPRDYRSEVLESHDPDVVVLWWGMNTECRIQAHHAAYRSMIRGFQDAGVVPVVLTTIPVCSMPYKDTRTGRVLESCGLGWGRTRSPEFVDLSDRWCHEEQAELDRALVDSAAAAGASQPLLLVDGRTLLQDRILAEGCCTPALYGEHPVWGTPDGIHMLRAGHEATFAYAADQLSSLACDAGDGGLVAGERAGQTGDGQRSTVP